MNTRFDVPHSRFNAVTPEQFAAAGLKVLAQSDEVGVHLAVSEDGLRLVFFQGHPEYDANSLFKEYKREVLRYFSGETDAYPPHPENYFSLQTRAILAEYRERVALARNIGGNLPLFPEQLISPGLDNTWHDSAESVINNWIGQVYRLAHRASGRDGQGQSGVRVRKLPAIFVMGNIPGQLFTLTPALFHSLSFFLAGERVERRLVLVLGAGSLVFSGQGLKGNGLSSAWKVT